MPTVVATVRLSPLACKRLKQALSQLIYWTWKFCFDINLHLKATSAMSHNALSLRRAWGSPFSAPQTGYIYPIHGVVGISPPRISI